ncbi:universal stress protein [Actinotalea sp. JY-7876]|uniref:universal stress protein n=1 Tax=Actinotalea sp. JY-7876 TaxID=2758442 RepID=UPI0015F763E7|nr:universal stress protein [Actinotalea sp. JY-7876]
MAATVVVGVDGTANGEEALAWAADAAATRGALLEVVHAVGQPAWGFDVDLDHAIEQQGKNLVEACADRAEQLVPGLRVRSVLVTDPPRRALLERSRDAALLVVPAGEGAGAWLAYRLAASARCPVALVPARRPSGVRSVVVGVDGSPDGRAALAFALAEAVRSGARLEVLRAWDAPTVPPAAILPTHGLADALRESEVVALREMLAPFEGAGVPLSRRLVRGRPARALLEAARDAQLLVVGAHGDEGLDGAALGSVSHEVVLHAPCPVVVAHAGGPV